MLDASRPGADADHTRREQEQRQRVPRMLTSEELAACCGGCRTGSAIEAWMKRAIERFCAVNGIPIDPGARGKTNG